jgi:hypothetical protein
MKRCPQCEFIYEDDQSLCDMDGALLVFDSRSLPKLNALVPVEATPAPSRSAWRHRTFPAMAALILATVFSLVYFVSTQRSVPVPAPPISAASVTAPLTNSNANQATPPDANESQPPAAAESDGAASAATNPAPPNVTNATHAAATAPAPAKKPSVTKSSVPPKPAEQPKKEDSKVGSILKKTGRFLKKPFKH